MKVYKYVFLFLLLSLSMFNLKTSSYEIINEKGYEKDKIVIYEFFYYGCRHCYNINNKMRVWVENGSYSDQIDYRRVPIIFSETSIRAAKHYFTSEILNISDIFSVNYYYEIHHNKLMVSDDLAYKILLNFYNIDIIENNMNSNRVKDDVERAKNLMHKYKVIGTPSFIINGKYKTDGILAGGNDRLIDVIEMLVEKEINNN